MFKSKNNLDNILNEIEHFPLVQQIGILEQNLSEAKSKLSTNELIKLMNIIKQKKQKLENTVKPRSVKSIICEIELFVIQKAFSKAAMAFEKAHEVNEITEEECRHLENLWQRIQDGISHEENLGKSFQIEASSRETTTLLNKLSLYIVNDDIENADHLKNTIIEKYAELNEQQRERLVQIISQLKTLKEAKTKEEKQCLQEEIAELKKEKEGLTCELEKQRWLTSNILTDVYQKNPKLILSHDRISLFMQEQEMQSKGCNNKLFSNIRDIILRYFDTIIEPYRNL